jgi:O-antigen/teichoic acid export membrane protein
VWIALVLGAGLWVAPVALGVSLICATIFLLGKYHKFLTTLVWTRPTGPCISWYRDMLPMQWRIALSWMSGYFTFSIFTPVLFWYHGPVVAGQMGMTWSLASTINIASSWLAPKVPQFGILAAQRKYDELDHLFWRITKIIIAISVAAGCCIWLFVYLLNVLEFRLANRILPPLPTTFFLLAQILQMISGPFSAYMRAHKTEPIVHISVMLGVLNGISAFTLGRYYSASGMGLGYLLINIALAPLLFTVWQRERHRWRFGNIKQHSTTAV